MGTFLLNWKTTVPALVAAITNALPMFGIIAIPDEIAKAITVTALFLIGLFARDADKSSEESRIK